MKEVCDVVIPTDREFVFNPCTFTLKNEKVLKFFYYTNIVLIENIT